MDNVISLRNQLSEVIKSADQLAFGEDTNDAILDYYFMGSCSRINSNNYFENETEISCSNPTPGCSIENPYNLGLAYAISRMHY